MVERIQAQVKDECGMDFHGVLKQLHQILGRDGKKRVNLSPNWQDIFVRLGIK